jgi:CheY-like chemotaxis protein
MLKESGDEAKGVTILVLEDERPLQAAIKSKLESVGFGVLITKTVNQALDYLKEGVKIDGIWLDHYLFEKEDGLDLVTVLRKDMCWKDLPIFVISNTISQEKFQQYLNLGVRKCYTKVDYKLGDIIADITKLLGGPKNAQAKKNTDS